MILNSSDNYLLVLGRVIQGKKKQMHDGTLEAIDELNRTSCALRRKDVSNDKWDPNVGGLKVSEELNVGIWLMAIDSIFVNTPFETAEKV